MITLTIFLFFTIILFSIFIFTFVSNVVAIFTTDSPFVSVSNSVKEKIVKNLELRDGSVLYDLGCGDARVLLSAVNSFPNIKAIGVEVAFYPYLLAKFKTRNYKQIEIRRSDIYKTNISDATHIFMYLYPSVVNKLVHNVEKQCKSRTKIISCDFEINSLKPLKIVELDSNDSKLCKKLFIYTL